MLNALKRGAVVVAAALVGCGGVESDRGPLTVVDETPEMTGAGRAAPGATAGSGPITVAPAASAGARACWVSQLPIAPLPLQPDLPVADACRLGATATSWTYPGTEIGGPEKDDSGLIVGRWVSCGGVGVAKVAHAGIEFGLNARYQLLTTDAAGALVPMSASIKGARGYYYALSTGQLDLTIDETGSPYGIYQMKFAQGMDTLSFNDADADEPTSAIYGRATPSSSNGSDNVPSTSAGRCSMVGTWNLPASAGPPGAPAASFSFDALGNFVGGQEGADLCAAHTMYGTYRLSPGWFQLTTNVGMGQCSWWLDAGYRAKLDDSCTHLTLVEDLDNCTGARGYFNGTTTLTRQP